MPLPLIDSIASLNVFFALPGNTQLELGGLQVHLRPVLVSRFDVLSEWFVDVAARNLGQNANMIIESLQIVIVVSELALNLYFQRFVLLL